MKEKSSLGVMAEGGDNVMEECEDEGFGPACELEIFDSSTIEIVMM